MSDATTARAGSTHADRLSTPQRGIAHLLHPTVLGSIIGAAGSTAFVLVNRDGLPGAWSSVALGAWVVVLGFFVWAVFLRQRMLVDPGPPHPAAGAVYVGSVGAMIAVMALGRVLLDRVDRPELQPAVVVIAVGLHFIPFAWAFRAPVFGRLGWSLSALGVVGLVLGLAAGAVPVAAAAVLTGLVMLGLMAVTTFQDAPTTPPTSPHTTARASDAVA